MHDISFIFKLTGDRTTYHGKMLDEFYCSGSVPNAPAIDIRIKHYASSILKCYVEQTKKLPGMTIAHVGIIATCDRSYPHRNPSNKEIDAFDMYLNFICENIESTGAYYCFGEQLDPKICYTTIFEDK